jgi:AcrR family transcriptional regulator
VAEDTPRAVAAAWRRKQERSAPGRRAGLSLATIVDAGLRVAVADGLGAVSMSRVASELGAATMSLYRHVSAKDELLTHMVDAAFAVAPDAPAADEDWRAGLTRWVYAHLAVLRRHRWLVRVPISGPPLMPNQVLWFERGLQCLRDTPLPPAEKPGVLLLVNGFVRNEATLETDLLHAAQASGASIHDAGAAYARVLSSLIDAERFPALHALLSVRTFEPAGTVTDDVQFGLDRILDGIDVLLRARAAGASPAAGGGAAPAPKPRRASRRVRAK